MTNHPGRMLVYVGVCDARVICPHISSVLRNKFPSVPKSICAGTDDRLGTYIVLHRRVGILEFDDGTACHIGLRAGSILPHI